MHSTITRYAYGAGMAYCCAMAIAHFFGLNYPLLFVYDDTPFYADSDMIISFAVCASIGPFDAAACSRAVTPHAIAGYRLRLVVLQIRDRRKNTAPESSVA